LDVNILSDIQALSLTVEEFNFKRHGLKNENKPQISFKAVSFVNTDNNELYKVNVTAIIKKELEYDLDVTISGVFGFADTMQNDGMRDSFINENAVAILVPFLRSQVALLTAQPDMDCISIPVINVRKWLTADEEN